MDSHLTAIIIMALVPLGAWTAMGEGMILHGLSERLRKLPPAFAKPLATCPRCMVTGWGIPAMLFLEMCPSLWLLPIYLLAAVGLQELLHQ